MKTLTSYSKQLCKISRAMKTLTSYSKQLCKTASTAKEKKQGVALCKLVKCKSVKAIIDLLEKSRAKGELDYLDGWNFCPIDAYLMKNKFKDVGVDGYEVALGDEQYYSTGAIKHFVREIDQTLGSGDFGKFSKVIKKE